VIARLRPAVSFEELRAAVSRRPGAVAQFEQSFASALGQRHALAFPYGRTGLRLLLESLEIRGREIICPAYTCVVVAHAIVASGNTPVFVDSRDDDFNMDLELAVEAIGPRTAAIVPTSLFGYPVDLDALDRIRSANPSLRVIQDCAHSFGAAWHGRLVQREGDAAVYGLNVSKIITSIFGGMVTTDSDDVAAALRATSARTLKAAGKAKEIERLLYLGASTLAFLPPVYRFVDELARRGVLGRFTDYYDEHVIDMPPDHLQAMAAVEGRVGVVQSRRYPEIVEHRRRIAAIYDEELQGVGGLRLPPTEGGATYSHYVVRMQQADAAVETLRREGVQLGRLIEYVVPELAAYKGSAFLDRGIARAFPPLVVNLPVHMGVRPDAAHRIARLVAAAVR
jgi:dTDP-4-amino-4,6-dideoxygalactose transaminase